MRFLKLLFFVILVPLANVVSANCPAPFKTSSANTFGVVICSSPHISTRHALHAQKILRNLIDYNGDFVPDNKKVLKKLLSNNAVFLVLSHGQELSLYEESLMEHPSFTVVYEEEMVLDEVTEFDATIEEALHLITAEGYGKVYPAELGEFNGSSISTFLDDARGGYFKNVPNRYPSKAYFTYYDNTCDYGCQITEFLYWTISTLRGQQRFDWRDSEIEEEWRPETREKLQDIAPELVEFLSKKEFAIFF